MRETNRAGNHTDRAARLHRPSSLRRCGSGRWPRLFEHLDGVTAAGYSVRLLTALGLPGRWSDEVVP
jgi:hypothetical protein